MKVIVDRLISIINRLGSRVDVKVRVRPRDPQMCLLLELKCHCADRYGPRWVGTLGHRPRFLSTRQNYNHRPQ